MKQIIAGIGEVLWDIFPDSRHVGGAPANFIYHINKLGHNGILISSIGSDENGIELYNSLRNKDISSMLGTSDKPTGRVTVNIGSNGIPTYDIMEDTAWDFIDYTPETDRIQESCAAVCFGTLPQRNITSRETIRRFVSGTSEESLRVCDLNLRQHFYDTETIKRSLELCNILKINHKERDIIKIYERLEGSDREFCIKLSRRYGIGIIILTYGNGGSLVMAGSEFSMCIPPEIKIADTVGAGDSFTAGFISKLIEKESVREAHRYATVLSAYVCTQRGGTPEYDFDIINRLEVKWEE
ncbi:MAG: carbohydrate kinase [Rikenellaceae bacterium]|nr:carbohydrate kinase [Rikenellaceae bacterium]